MKKLNFIFLAVLIASFLVSCEKEGNEPSEKQVVLSLQPDGIDGKDANFSFLIPDRNMGDNENIHLYAWTQNGELNVNRVAIDFDLSSIPADAQIDSAFISFYYNNTSIYGAGHSGDNSFVIERITSAWEESTITWNNQPSTTSVDQVSVPASVSATQDFTDINISDLVADILNDQANSYGFLLKFQNEDPYKILLFASSDHPDATIRPKLDVYYTVVR